jgi:DNA-binding Lrp family transcriptional regulator
MDYKLDLKDKKLLYELDLNSRQSLGAIGKKIGLSKNSVKYRIDNLKKVGIIKQFHTVVDISKLGYIGFRLYLNLRNTTSEKEKEIIEFLSKKDIVTWLVSIDGKYDLGALILTKTIKEMDELWNELNQKYNNFLEEKLLTIMTKVRYFSRAFLKELKSNDYEIAFVSEPQGEIEKQDIDEIDWKILNLLAPNARLSIINIADKLDLNEKTVISRIKKLEAKKIIIGYKTVFDLEKLGYLYYKLHFKIHNSSKELIRELKSYIKIHPNIIYDDEVLGGDNIEIELQVKDTNELRKIIDEIKERFGKIIGDYFTLLFFKEHKYLFLPVKF